MKIHVEPSIIVAYDANRLIGNSNYLPWLGELPSDMRHFRAKTIGQIVLMGRSTYDSIGKALPGRENRVLSRDSSFAPSDATVFRDTEDALLVDEDERRKLIVIGGSAVYEQYLPNAAEVHVTEIEFTFQGDKFFPVLDVDAWREVDRVRHDLDDDNLYAHSFVTYRRNRKYIDVSKARSPEQHEQFRTIEKNGICPFCPDHISTYHDGEINYQNGWVVIENMIPYENTQRHMVIIPPRHITHISELSDDEWSELGVLMTQLSRDMNCGGLAIRFGDVEQTGASVAHLHFHLLQPEDDLPEDRKVKFKISR